MNYWKDKHAWQEGKPPKGSYNIIHFTDVFRDGVNIVIHFVTGDTRRLEAPNAGIARQWVQFINLRRRWFEDIHSARESERKVKQKVSKGVKVRASALAQYMQLLACAINSARRARSHLAAAKVYL